MCDNQAVLHVSKLFAQVSAVGACRGADPWHVTGPGSSLTVSRDGWRPPGLRHRLPVEVRDQSGTLVARVVRSRGMKGLAGRFDLFDGSGAPLGSVGRSHRRRTDPARLSDAAGAEIGSLAEVDVQLGSGGATTLWQYDGVVQGVSLQRSGARKKRDPAQWELAGLDGVDDERHRLLVALHALVVEPWARGEDADSSDVSN